jgi:acyl-CoA synthetase (AMP-forming)/AMP-acid ligase II/acyl carrier protein
VLTYARLADQMARIGTQLNQMGIGRGDRVAIVLPNGPEMAGAFLCVSAFAACAPLNPSFRRSEFENSLDELNPNALIAPAGMETGATQAAQIRKIPILDLSFEPDAEAGVFALQARNEMFQDGPSAQGGAACEEDIALLLHTSGTGTRPKLVPLTQRNICTSARIHESSLELTQDDRCLNVMPLFHIHGLITAVLSPIAAGSSVVCTPGPVVTHFFEWLGEFKPTWYSASPSIHKAILDRETAHPHAPVNGSLRFVRSAAGPLPPKVAIGLENFFHVPVIEAYGMTEASSQICSNPLPPETRKWGSVGIPTGTEVEILGSTGEFLEPGEAGEVVIRGDSLMRGYENDPAANASAFLGSWLRTGDEGYFDEDGYLFLSGRIKEIINRGGEKISPREVDETLLDHPAVAEAVTFPVPDDRLGEEVGAAVVLQENSISSSDEITDFAAQNLADFKVPRRLVIVDAIPKGPTGKIRRLELSEKLGLGDVATEKTIPYTAPRTRIEKALVQIWEEVLRLDRVGVQDDFLDIGGDSILATQIISRVLDTFRVGISMQVLFRAPTVAEMALVVERHSNGEAG